MACAWRAGSAARAGSTGRHARRTVPARAPPAEGRVSLEITDSMSLSSPRSGSSSWVRRARPETK
eukprot:10476044-Alexandrium_andersonii.AAC.1